MLFRSGIGVRIVRVHGGVINKGKAAEIYGPLGRIVVLVVVVRKIVFKLQPIEALNLSTSTGLNIEVLLGFRHSIKQKALAARILELRTKSDLNGWIVV